MKEKIISLILAVFVLTAMFSFEAFADSTSVKVYNSPDGTATINTPAQISKQKRINN